MSGMFLFREFDSLDPEENTHSDDSDEERGPVINTTTISSPQMARKKKKASLSMSPKMVSVNSPVLRAPSSLRQSSSHGTIESPKSSLTRSMVLPKSSSLIPEPVKKDAAPAPNTAATTPELNLLRPRNAPSLVPVMLPSRSRSLAPGDEASTAALKVRLLDEPKDFLVSKRRASTISVLHKTPESSELLPSHSPVPGSPSLQPKSILKKSSKSMDILDPLVVKHERSMPLHQSTASLQLPSGRSSGRRLSKSEAGTSAKPVSELNVSTNSLLSMMNLGEKKRDRKEEEKRKLEATQNAFRARYEKTFGRDRSVQLFGE